ncbi:hypothetical protein H2198_005240 [Neophaeococcomyces mojaviensis]|uniref:Uncharacterized protein n=1 Tax=Neophaeococcomyces mojaviensis TaxID=3383035 RepID=A0ACC3A644_9EURO|nr:hypothetical protein H2198_005240 [Knufia sp. JES_112]
MATSAPAPKRLIHNLSQKPPSTCRAETIDFEQVGLTHYKGKFAVLIHDLLSAEECKELLEAAEEASGFKWEGAMVNVGNGRQEMMTDVRLCDRILWDASQLVDVLGARIKPFLPENVVTLKDCAGITGAGPVKRKETYQMTRLNERLRFLKYGRGMYFRPHCDGSYVTPDGSEISYLTVHLYLNGTPAVGDEERTDLFEHEKPLLGGATRFFGPGWRDENNFDVNPTTGACLVFQHRGLIHSGEEVQQGTKYTVRTDIMFKKVVE